MAERRPLIINSGQIEEMPAGDNIPAATTPIPAGGTAGQVLQKVDGADYNFAWATPASGSSTFLALTDTPTDYVGSNGKGVRVNAGSSALEFYDIVTELPVGGSPGQVLAKSSGTDFDVAWVDAASGGGGGAATSIVESIIIAVSDETSDLSVGNAQVSWRMPYNFTLDEVRANVVTAPTGADLNIDINMDGSSILTTPITIDATEKTSTTAAVPAVISTPNLTDDSEITIDIDQVGAAVIGTGLKVILIGRRAIPEAIMLAGSDETTALTVATNVASFRMPYALTLTEVRASLTTAGTISGTVTVDINQNGISILSTTLTIDTSELTSTTAAIAAVLSTTALADDAEITVDIDAVDGGGTATGLKVYLIGTKA